MPLSVRFVLGYCLVWIISMIYMGYVIITVHSVPPFSMIYMGSVGIPLLISIFISYYFFKGKNWARIALIGLLFLGIFAISHTFYEGDFPPFISLFISVPISLLTEYLVPRNLWSLSLVFKITFGSYILLLGLLFTKSARKFFKTKID